MPVGADGAVLVRQRMAQMGREATNRIREEMKQLGQKIVETNGQVSVGNAEDERKGRSFKPHGSHVKTERARSV